MYKLAYLLFFLNLTIYCSSVDYITSQAVITSDLSTNAIIRQEPGFETDFLILHCLLRKYNPKRLFEVGTCEGYGTLIMANACPGCEIISLELPPYTAPYFISPSAIGSKCNRPYKQVFGNSLTYDYSQHFPLDAWFIDGAHDYIHVKHETLEAVKSGAPLIIYHDTDIKEVFQAVQDGLENTDYRIYRVTDSRISYAIK